MKKKIILFLFFFCFQSFSQGKYWNRIENESISEIPKLKRAHTPSQFKVYSLDIELFKQSLVNIPVRGVASTAQEKIIYLPNATGELEPYAVFETPIMEPELAERYPMIKSYAAQGIQDPTAIARFTVTQFGLHSMVLSAEKSTVYIEPYSQDRTYYMVFQKSDLTRNSSDFVCTTEEDIIIPSSVLDRNAFQNTIQNTNDGLLRTYRIALSCTAEYGNLFAGTGTLAEQKANILAQMAITMNRVNGVYELDLGITMIFVANNDAVIYLGATNADPWNGEFNTTTAQTLDAIIGVNNYDIGHNFNTTGGGNAGCIACVCQAVSQTGVHKGRGYTGRANPTGDAFDIDYVAHEIGHQFGGFHTQSNSSCRSGSGQTEVEPGSASTIMGYAGICAANVQSNSDAYFAYVNIRDIMAYVKTPTGSCSVNTPTGNNAPVVDAGRDYTIPRSTPFILTATGSDIDGDALTYNWEQNDPENPASNAAPANTRLVGPMFRSLTATASPSRFFPALATVLAGNTQSTWEVVPSVSRTMDFSVVARDNVAGGGQTASDLMTVTVNATAGPFVVTSPNTNVNWNAGSNQNITWNVAGTTTNGVNCEFVDIFLSTNGGTLYPTLLAANVPNDGSETVTIPNNVNTTSRVMIRGRNHIFYDVSNTNFRIASVASGYLISYDRTTDGQRKIICQGQTTSYNVLYETIGTFSSTVNLSATGNPAGTTVTLSQNSIATNGSFTVTVTSTNTVSPGLYPITITATSGATTRNVTLYLVILQGNFFTIAPVAPLNLAFGVPIINTTLSWLPDVAATQYDVQLATDVDFNNIIFSTTVTTSSVVIPSVLTDNQNYFWRVLPKNEACQGSLSPTFRFTTLDSTCFFQASTNVPLTISATGTPTVNSTLTIPSLNNQIIDTVEVSLNISHTWLSDLTVSLISPTGTIVQLFTNQCGSSDNAIATFTSTGAVISCSSNPALSGTFAPTQPFSSFTGQDSQGTWTLRVFDSANQDGGTINSWSVTFCTIDIAEPPCGAITSIWDGTSWSNGFPVDNVEAIIQQNYIASRDLSACSLTIQNNAQVTIASGYNFTITNEVDIATGSTLTIESNANLIQQNNVLNSGNAIVKRNTNPLMRLDYVQWSSPVIGNQTLKQFSPQTVDNRFYNYITSSNIYTAIASPQTTLFESGKGYLIRMPNNHPTTPTIWEGVFNGTLFNGNLTVNLQNFGSQNRFNMIGNPYPSTIDAEAFLLDNNANIEGVLYFWRKTNNALGTAYATYTLGGATTTSPTSPIPNGVIQTGQGFITQARNIVNPTVNFTNSQRISNNQNQFFRNLTLPSATLEKHRIWLNLTNNQDFFHQMMVGYVENTTNDFDDLFDGRYFDDDDTYLVSKTNDDLLSIQCKALPFNAQDVIPLQFKTTQEGTFSIALAQVDGLFEDYPMIIIEDVATNSQHNLKESAYEFSSLEGVYPDRFRILFENTLLSNPEIGLSNTIAVWGSEILNIKSTVKAIEDIQIFDTLGRLLLNKKSLQLNHIQLDRFTNAKQTLFIKIKLDDGSSITKKIIF